MSGLRSDCRGDGERLIVRPLGSDVPHPLAVAQERFWFLNQLDPSSPADNVAVGLRIEGPLDCECYRQAWDGILQRHAILRTNVAILDGEPHQVVSPSTTAMVHLSDLRHLSPPLAEEEALRLATLDADLPFDLMTGPVYRLRLWRIADETHLALAVIHHIACDLWSLGILSHELSELYNASAAGRQPALPNMPFQYTDYAVAHRQWVEGRSVGKQLDYWRAQLANASLSEIPPDRPRLSRPGVGATGAVDLAEDLIRALRAFAAQEGVTPFMVLIAAFSLLIGRYTGQPDVVIGTPIANRTRLELKGLVGTFVNTLVFRTNISEAETFSALIASVRQVALDAFANQDISFHRLVTEINPVRPAGRGQFFQTLFSLQNAPVRVPSMHGLTLAPVTLPRKASQFDLAVWVDTDVLRQVGFAFDTSLFDRGTIERLINHYITLLRTVVQEPARPLSEIELLTPQERQVITKQWNDTGKDFPKCSVVELFRDQANRTPASTAVQWRDSLLSYRDLDVRSDAVAAGLQRQGIVSGSVVGVCLSRGIDLVAALLGVMKAGGVYLPLDPTYPQERLSYMIRDAGSSLVVVDNAAGLDLDKDVPSIDLATLTEGWTDREPSLPGPRLADVAYVIYTSGSTGSPKGVEITHAALSNFLFSMQARLSISRSDRLLAVTTLSFDIAGLELYLPLISGATVVIADRQDGIDPHRLATLVDRCHITLLQATPTTWRMLVDSGWSGRSELTILCGGEMLTRDLADKLLSRGKALWNLYGPTETTVWSTMECVEQGQGTVSIGRPIDNTQVYVLDAHGKPAPIGVHGELFIGGAGVARGYLGRPDLTEERFVTDPFCQQSGAKMYRTGDVARFLPDGRLEIVGRSDHQVKIRGFRVELGEVEACLAALPSVMAAVTTVRHDSTGEASLDAYVVPNPKARPTPQALRLQMSALLPHYMVPSRVVFLHELPTTLNGKINRAALPQPNHIDTVSDTREVPATALERRLERIWAEELELPFVAVNDDFFDLGGHSLLAVKLATRIKQAIGCSVPVVTVLEARTIRQLACEIESRFAAANVDTRLQADRAIGRYSRQSRTGNA